MVTPRNFRLAIGAVFVLILAGPVDAMATIGEAPPVITAQPQPQTSFVGANINLRVSATSLAGVRYRWRFYGTDLPHDFPGQSTPLLTLENVTLASAGPYSVVVSNSFGAVTSATATVTVNIPFANPLAVGYINLNAVPGLSLFTSALAHYSFESGQTVGDQINATVDGASLFKVDGTGFLANNYLDGWSAPEMLLTLGEGWFFRNPTTNVVRLTELGRLQEGWLYNVLPAGHSLCASLVPQRGLLSTTLFLPATSGTKVFRFDSASQAFQPYSLVGQEWQPSEPSANVGEAIFVYEPVASSWARWFSLDGWPPDPRWASFVVVQPQILSETGEINFFTYNPDGSGRVLDLDGATPLNSQFVGQLYAGTNDTEAALAPIGKPVPFLDGAGAGYIRSATVKIPGAVGGQTIFLQLRVWEKCAGDTYEQAVFNGSASGRSAVFSAIAHATIEDGGPGLPPRNANTFPIFQVSLGHDLPIRVARIESVGANVEICFATQPGWVYCLQKAIFYEEPMAWTTVSGSERIVGTGHVARITDNAGKTQSFYRVSRVQ